MKRRYDELFRVQLPAELATFVREEANAALISEAAVLRQAVAAWRATALRRDRIEAEVASRDTGVC